jgi:Predicted transcriptional regulator
MTHIKQKPKQPKYPNDLRFRRRERRLSRKEVAHLLGKSLQTIRKYEQGAILPPTKLALKLQVLYRTQLAGIYQDLYSVLTTDIRAAEESIRAHRRSGGAA